MKKPSHSNNGRRRSHQQPRKVQGRTPTPPTQQNRPRSQNSSQNKQATEMWMKPTSDTLTSHIPMGNSKPGQRDSNSQNNRRPSQGQGQGQQGQSNGRPRQGQQQNRFGGSRNSSNERQFKSRPYTPPVDNVNGNGKLKTPAPIEKPPVTTAPTNSTSLPVVDADVPRPAGLKKLTADIEPFELFCAYHLGITQERGYKPSNINEVARRFRTDPATIKQALKEYDMDPAALMDRDFDMALGQLDIQVAPEGVDRKELAKNIYQEFLEAEVIKRDWGKILEEDRKENQKIFKD